MHCTISDHQPLQYLTRCSQAGAWSEDGLKCRITHALGVGAVSRRSYVFLFFQAPQALPPHLKKSLTVRRSYLWLSIASESATEVCDEHSLEVLDIVRGFRRGGELDTELRIVARGVKDEALRCTER